MGKKQIKLLVTGLIFAFIFNELLNLGIKIHHLNQAVELGKNNLAQRKEQPPHKIEQKTQESSPQESLDTAQGAFKMGWDYLTHDDYDGAIGAFSKAIDLDPKNFSAYDNRGNAYFFKGSYENAILDYNKALEINAANSPTYDFLARSYYKMGEFDKAWESVHRAGKLGHTLDPKFIDTLNKYSGKNN